jgi:hypothetical protein
MRLERQHGRNQRPGLCRRHDLGQQRLMTAVDAVEVADRERTGHSLGGWGNTAKDFHGRLEQRRDYTKASWKTLILLALSSPRG